MSGGVPGELQSVGTVFHHIWGREGGFFFKDVTKLRGFLQLITEVMCDVVIAVI